VGTAGVGPARVQADSGAVTGVARVAALVPDLLFGSNVLGSLRAAGHEAVLVNDPASIEPEAIDVLIVDLTAEAKERIALIQAANLAAVPTLAFYSHVENEVRALGEQAGFELVIPRSRMAREGASLVARLAAHRPHT
jgi:hypothetical protein